MIAAPAYARARSVAEAIEIAGDDPSSVRYLAGGTSLVDLMKLGVAEPAMLVDLGGIDELKLVAASSGGGLRIGALVTNAELARTPRILADYPLVAQALGDGASAAIRAMATVGGNLLQATRCPYFRDPAAACNRRVPGSGCSAVTGWTRPHAVLGVSDDCIATHPSDLAVTLAALDATVEIAQTDGRSRTIGLADLYPLPGRSPQIEHALAAGELICAVELPPPRPAWRSRYLKVRDRSSFAFAIASAAVLLDVDDGSNVAGARIALGGVATVPWRARAAEAALLGRPATPASFEAAAAVAVEGARTLAGNAFKVPLAKATLVRALQTARGAT